MKVSEVFDHRISIVTGHYGTGKTEFAVNLALALAEEQENVMVADLDIVNPYFRSRERRKEFEAAGIKLISSSQEAAHADIPALPAELLGIFQNRAIRGVLEQLSLASADGAVDVDLVRQMTEFTPDAVIFAFSPAEKSVKSDLLSSNAGSVSAVSSVSGFVSSSFSGFAASSVSGAASSSGVTSGTFATPSNAQVTSQTALKVS